jgi:hypothetical protein
VINYYSSTLTLNNSTVTGNTAFQGGGVLNSNSSTATLNNSTLSGNSAGYRGGGVFNSFYVSSSTLILNDSTITGNTAGTSGGGVFNLFSTVTLTNSTLTGNTAAFQGGGVFNGYYLSSSTLTLTNSTITGNTAGDRGGGVFNDFSTVTLARTLVAGNTASSAAEISNSRDITADNYNLFGHSGLTNAQAFSGFSPGATDLTATLDGSVSTALSDILDTTLADNGGPTLTHALVTGSPAIDASPVDADCQATDQRGITRPQGAACDIGAFEFASVASEICGNCQDDDGDGKIDLLDDDCQPTNPLTVTKGSFTLKPDFNKDSIFLQASFPSAGVTINPPVDGVAISFFDGDGSIECLAIPPNSAGWKENKKGTAWSFKDAEDDSLDDPEADEKVRIKLNAKKGVYEVTVKVKEAELTDPEAGLISSGIVIGDELRVNQQPWESAAKGKQLVTP